MMNKIGDIKKAQEIGKKGHDKYIWSACEKCGKERWVIYRFKKAENPCCPQCGCGSKQGKGEGNPSWKGGRRVNSGDYIIVWTPEDDFFYPMANKRGYILEHRLIMAQYLGRNLHRWELVHHKGIEYPIGSRENKQDNRVENLQIVVVGEPNGRHMAKMACPYCHREFRVI